MVKGLITEQYLNDIGNAIREKNDSNEVYYPSEMASAILAIPTGSEGVEPTTSLVLTSNKVKTTGDVTLTATLSTYRDYDVLEENGYLEGAEITFYKMLGATPNPATDTSLSTSITNNVGVATSEVNITENSNLYARFDGISSIPNVNSNVVNVTVESYLFYDKCDSATTLTSYGSSETMRNSGTSTIGHTDDYHTITNTKREAESIIPILDLTGLSSNFSIEFDSYIQGSNGSSGFVIYNDSNNWCKLTDDGNNKYWIGYNVNGSFTEQGFSDIGNTAQEWIHGKFTIQDGIFKVELSRDDIAFYTKQYTLPSGFNITPSTRFGLDSEWQQNTVTRYKEIKVVSLSGE